MRSVVAVAVALCGSYVTGFLQVQPASAPRRPDTHMCANKNLEARIVPGFVAAAMVAASVLFPVAPGFAMQPAAKEGASSVSDTKMLSGAASTLDTGSRKIITRGVNLENADFHGKDMSGVSFQQSLVRGTNFASSKLIGSGFFDADLSNCDFTNANMNQANLEMANLKGSILKNAIVTEAYVSGATKFEPKDIEGADFTDTFLRKDQIMYLCAIAKGTNPVTGVDTADSLSCN
ncbi:hypothetical protein JKP88DRAFT_202926 [Tribonema minus]|uniref:Uncharacterized protein n=1 Tax=Tribonema minus TaxID=303371 RepID=A0A835YUD1_9STRA|nr:hypothetical protein JKP88DRAFT_202926 [Tribonema minus]